MRKYATITRISVINALQYRASVLMGFLFYTMFLFVFFNLWRAIYAGGQVQGYTFTQMIWYLCVTEMISYGARVRIHRDIAEDVKSGTIAYQLLRPFHYIGYQAANALGQIVYSFVMFGMLALLIGFVAVGPIEGFQIWTLPFSMLSLALGIALNFMLLLCLGLCAFRLEDVQGLSTVYSKLVFMTGTFIPIEFLPGWIQGIVKYLPFSYVSWGPAKLAVAFTWADFARIVPVQAFWLILATTAACALYQNGMRGLQTNGG